MESEDRERLRKYDESGDEMAFGSLVRKYLGLVFALAHRRTGDRELAEEIVYNVFAKLAAKAGRMKEGASIVGWLHQAAVLESANALRKETNRNRKMRAYSTQLDVKHEEPECWDDEECGWRAARDEITNFFACSLPDWSGPRFMDSGNFHRSSAALPLG